MTDREKVKFSLKYKLHKQPLGKGSFSTVYLGTDVMNQKYAIKAIPLDKLDPKRIDKFALELEILPRLHHPNIVNCFETFRTQTHWYLVNELCTDGTMYYLKNVLNESNFVVREEEVKKYLKQLKDALQYLYNNKIIHRDIKPSNILLVKQNNDYIIKLSDFGFARYYDYTEDDLTGTVCGSPTYMAPELLIKGKSSVKTDLWSFGIIMYEFLHGCVPYEAFTYCHLVELIKTSPIIYNRRFSSQCIHLLKRLLKINPNERITWNEFFVHPWFNDDEMFQLDEDYIDNQIVVDEEYHEVTERDYEEFKEVMVSSSLPITVKAKQTYKYYQEQVSESFIKIFTSSFEYLFGRSI